jgi:hypothetical protein
MFRQFFSATLIVCAVVGASAQQPAPPAARQGQARPQAGDAADQAYPPTLPEGQLAAMLDTYAIVQAQQALAIPDDRYGTFAARLKKLQDVRRRNQRLHRQILQQLRMLAGPRAPEGADEAAIRKLLVALREQDDRAAIEMRQAYEALDEVLDVRQQARFRMFEDQIEQRKLDLLVRARERARANKDGTR